MKILSLAIAFSLIGMIFGVLECKIGNTKDKNINNFADCRNYSTTEEDKVCCYVNGKDKNENTISACHELTGTVKGALKDLNSLEGLLSDYKDYYLNADCNLGQILSICDPDDKKSESPLSVEECSKYPVLNVDGVSEDSKCCYVTGKNISGKNVYSCARNDPIFYTIQEMKKKIESGDYKRLWDLNEVNIECPYYEKFYSASIISLLFSLLNFL